MGNHSGAVRADTGPGVIRITKAGWFYIFLTIFLGVSGINTGNNLIYLIVAAFLSFMAVSGIFGKRNLSKIDVRLEFPEEIYAKTSVPVKVIMRNNRRFLPVFLMRVHMAGADVLFPFVDVKSEGVKYLSLPFRERGRSTVRNMYLSSVFPFHFFIRFRPIPGVFDAIVFPGTKQCGPFGSFERQKKSRGELTSDRTGYESDIISLRDYIEGDPLKYIHWKASAKTDRLKTKELSALSHQPVIIDFESLPLKDLEEKISCVTYLLLKLIKRNIPVGLKIDGAVFRPFSRAQTERRRALKLAMLTKLALYPKRQ
jgi:uncharacterized protein (DUF58 family)